MSKYVIAVYVDNKPGVLTRVSSMFTRRAFNIDTLTVGEIENPDGIGTVGNASCGDIMQITIKVENNIIVDAKFKTFGCAAAIATSSTATEMVKGMTIEEALKITNQQVVDELGGLPPAKIHCSVLAKEAIEAAITDYYNRLGIKNELTEKACNGCCENCNHHHE